MFTQILDPTGNLFVTWLVALIPVVLLLFLLAGLRMSAWLAVLIGSIVTFLLFAAAILLLITTISAPVIGDIAILKVMLTNRSDIRNSSVTFGTFGHCVLDVAPVQ